MKTGLFTSVLLLAVVGFSVPAAAKARKSARTASTHTTAEQRPSRSRNRAHAATDKEPTSTYYSLLRFYPYPDRSPGGTENWLRNESAKQDYDGYEAYDNSVKQRANQITAIPSMGIYR